MKGQTLIVPEYSDIQGPLVFLAGPIQGAEDWQNKAIDILRENAPDLNIASPRREYLTGEFVYEKQVDWETHYLQRASENGCIMFWLAKEKEHFCHRAYAQTTRFELAEWTTKKLSRDYINIVIGIEEGFTGAKYIKHRLGHRFIPIPFCDFLEETCLRAIKEIYNPE